MEVFTQTVLLLACVIGSTRAIFTRNTTDRCCPDACCNGIFFGGLTGSAPEFLAKDCQDMRELGGGKNGLYTIYPTHIGSCDGVRVYCDQATDGGGWTVIQRRTNGWLDFQRGWDEYRNGFGFLTGEFWLGLDHIHHISTQTRTELTIYMEDWLNTIVRVHYWDFWVGDEASNYTLSVKNFDIGSDVPDGLKIHHGMKFTTFDRDNDRFLGNCAVDYTGAWWYNACLESNLNGQYLRGNNPSAYGQGVVWTPWTGYTYSLKTVVMMIRPVV
ncbi:fibrinogen C domain-containing protein 1-like [Acanthaster planci]|uniref:Fibrinogen C domain-containing protein 1-like n=1 Tax=Acanthaster planci TaxID=133434 RepID=A0A8B7XJ71_ACAPL|nr:fibrinogen C domain-containing protein 1-like [Acanthaster planci]